MAGLDGPSPPRSSLSTLPSPRSGGRRRAPDWLRHDGSPAAVTDDASRGPDDPAEAMPCGVPSVTAERARYSGAPLPRGVDPCRRWPHPSPALTVNKDATPAHADFSVDTAPPVATINTGPTGPTNNT